MQIVAAIIKFAYFIWDVVTSKTFIQLAGVFGGGGHTNAAGARFRDIEMTVMIPKILNEAEYFYNNYLKG